METATPQDRSSKIEEILENYYESSGTPSAIDIIADLMHYNHINDLGIDFDEALRVAENHFESETEGLN